MSTVDPNSGEAPSFVITGAPGGGKTYAGRATETEPTAHLFEITDQGQLEALRASTDYEVPLRAAAIVYTVVNPQGRLSLAVAPPGYAVWVRPADEFDELFREVFGIEQLPVSIPWSALPLEITLESPDEALSGAGLGADIQVVEANENREIVVPLDWAENPDFPSAKYLDPSSN